MKKTIYLIRGDKTESYGDFKTRIVDLSQKAIEKYKTVSLKIVLTEKAPPAVSIIPFKKEKIVSISVFTIETAFIKEFIDEKGFAGLYEATEALPVAYNKTWDDGKVTPGVCLLTLFNQKKAIGYNTFINRWHNSHTPLSLKIHPLTHYNRNVVAKNGKENNENWDGIVEEHTKTTSDLLNPIKFFGGFVKMIPNMISVYSDTKSFLDYGTIETYLTQEYFIKS